MRAPTIPELVTSVVMLGLIAAYIRLIVRWEHQAK